MTTPGQSDDGTRLITPGPEVLARLMSLIGDVSELSDRVRRLETAIERIHGLLDDIETHTAAGDVQPAGTDPGSADGAPDDTSSQDEQVERLDMRLLVAWVDENITHLLERKIPQSHAPHWCRRWWLHPEAIERFEAVRRSWKEAVVSPGNALVVYHEHRDHEIGVLMGPGGPFSWCTQDTHSTGPITNRLLGQDDPDEGYYLAHEQAQQHTTPTPPRRPDAEPEPGPDGPRLDDRQTTTRSRQRQHQRDDADA